MLAALANLDGNLLLWIQEHIRNDFLTPIFTLITSLGDKGSIWLIICLLLLLSKKTRNVGIMGIIALCLSLIINNGILKNVVARTRPYEVVPGLQPLIPFSKDFSFPSGHTGASFAAAVVFFKKLPHKYGIPALIIAGLIAFSRLYLGVHYPTDVICGVISGVLIGLLSCKIGEYLQQKKLI